MVPTDSHEAELISPWAISQRSKLALLGLGAVAVTYVALIMPAQQHLAAMERQCRELTRAVQQLQGQEVAAQRGLELLQLLAGQAEKLDQAEDSLKKLIAVRAQLVEEAHAVASSTSAVAQLQEARLLLSTHGQGLEQLTQSMQQLAEVSDGLASSSAMAGQATRAVSDLAEQQQDLSREITTLGKQLTMLENQLLARSSQLPAAEQSLAQLGALCTEIASEQERVATARTQLVGLGKLKTDILQAAAGWEEARQLLASLEDLRDHVLRSQQTIAAAQQMVVEVILLEPAMERAVAALQPLGEVQRNNRREARRQQPAPHAAARDKAAWSQALHIAALLLTGLG